MATYTENYNLEKPDLNETADIEVINNNMDIIDTQLKATTDKVSLQNTIYQCTGTANTYSITMPNITSYTDLVGVSIIIKINVDSTGISTININNLGVKSLKKSNGNDMVLFKANGVYTIVFDGTNFQLQGEGGEIPKLPNLIKNGSFENGLNCWYSPSYGSTLSIATNYKKYGLNGANLFIPSLLTEGYLMQDNIKYIQGHKYYVCYWVLSSANGKTSSVYFPATGTFPTSEVVTCTNAYTWYFNSFISADASIASGNYTIRIDNDNESSNLSMIFDGVMILDLTDAFGAGKEPTKADMDYLVQTVGWWDSDLTQLTSDATALPENIDNGKIAYVNGQRISGISTKHNWATGTYSNTITRTETGTKQLEFSIPLTFTPRIVIIEYKYVGVVTFYYSTCTWKTPVTVNYPTSVETYGVIGSSQTGGQAYSNVWYGFLYASMYTNGFNVYSELVNAPNDPEVFSNIIWYAYE